MRSNKILRWLFTKKGTNTDSAARKKLSTDPMPSNSLYRSIVELPLKLFISCLVTGDLTYLIKSGSPTNKEIDEAWDVITEEYATATGNHEHRLYISLMKELALLKCDYKLILTLIQVLREVYDKRLASELNKLLTVNFKFDISNPVQYNHELDRCIKRSKDILLNIELKESQFKAIQEKFTTKQSKPTKEYFHSILITLSDHAKYSITDRITVYEFCERLKRFTQYVESLKSKK